MAITIPTAHQRDGLPPGILRALPDRPCTCRGTSWRWRRPGAAEPPRDAPRPRLLSTGPLRRRTKRAIINLTMSAAGAPAALRGYRHQALYTLFRILTEPPTRIFQLEGLEDLDILAQGGTPLELVQVKAVEGPLTLSALAPEKKLAFFRRVLARTAIYPNARERLVSFGPFGAEMVAAWKESGPARRTVLERMKSWGYGPADASRLLARIELAEVASADIETTVLSHLRDTLVGIDPNTTFDLLYAWLLVAAESRTQVTRATLVEKITAIGRFLADRSAHHRDWYTSIVPLENAPGAGDRHALAREFYRGVGARYDHITAGVDVVRSARLAEIDLAFQNARLVVVHGASGQGKTALCYRYLHNFAPRGWAFEIRLVENRRHALRIARALLGHMNAIGGMAYIFLDVPPANLAWMDLVRELAQLQNTRLLLAIRAEDWRRTTFYGAPLEIREIELDFNAPEAKSVYDQLTSVQPPPHLLAFDEAWSRFGRKGPLLEFAYFVVQNETLRARLSAQVRRLEDDVRGGLMTASELDLLRLVAVATAYGGRLMLDRLLLRVPLLAPRRTLELFEQEYLLRLGTSGHVVEGLHPIRSELLAALLTDETSASWAQTAAASLSLINDDDVESFLLHATSRRRAEVGPLLSAVNELRPETWISLAGVLRALLWLGVRDYVAANEELIREARAELSGGWSLAVNPDLGNLKAVTGESYGSFLDLFPFTPDDTRRAASVYYSRLSDHTAVTSMASAWLAVQGQPILNHRARFSNNITPPADLLPEG